MHFDEITGQYSNISGETACDPAPSTRRTNSPGLSTLRSEIDGKLKVVLPVGIEPTTSPLPRECSTTELRQHSGSDTGPRCDRKAIH